MTMTLVSTVTVGSGGAASIDFTSIPATATDIFLVFSAKSSPRSADSDQFFLRFNNDSTAANYSSRELAGYNGSVYSASHATGLLGYIFSDFNIGLTADTATANTFGNVAVYIPNYAASTAKSVSIDAVRENNSSNSGLGIIAGLWNNSSALNRITLTSNGSLGEHSTASLYIITKGSGGATTSP